MQSENSQHIDLTEKVKKSPPLVLKIMVVLVIMSVMGGSLTGIMTYAQTGYNDLFWGRWMSSFAMVVVVIIPSAGIVMALLNRLVNRFFDNFSHIKKNIIVGVMMAFVMETIMAAVTAANIVGISSLALYWQAWLEGFLAALPVGLLLSIVMSLAVKPKLEAFMKS